VIQGQALQAKNWENNKKSQSIRRFWVGLDLQLNRENIQFSSTPDSFGNESLLFVSLFSNNPYLIFDVGMPLTIGGISLRYNSDCLEQLLSDKTSSDMTCFISSISYSLLEEKICISCSADMVNWDKTKLVQDKSGFILHARFDRNVRYIKIAHKGISYIGLKDAFLINCSKPVANDITLNTRWGVIDNLKLYMTSNDAGFFSLATLALAEISSVEYELDEISAKYSHRYFKNSKSENPWVRFYSLPDRSVEITSNDKQFAVTLRHHSNYKNIDYSGVTKLVKKYFNPSEECNNLVTKLESKYQINYPETIAVCFRGTDKYKEVAPSSLEEYINAVQSALNVTPNSRILIQTDSKKFRDAFVDRLGGKCFFLEELPVTDSSLAIHYQIQGDRTQFAQYILASVLIIAKCNYVITHTGNTSYWICLYRGGCENLIQLL
jgi:hypothetical protein